MFPSTTTPTRRPRIRFKAHLDEATGMDWRLTWHLPEHAVWAEMVGFPAEVPYPADWPAAVRPLEIPLAVDRDGAPVCWNADADPMGGIAGRTNTGKTVAVGNLVIGCGRAGWELYLVDGKLIELGRFRGRRGVRQVATDPADWYATIGAAYRELQARKTLLANGGTLAGKPPVLLVIDELPAVLALEKGATKPVKERNKPRQVAAQQITQIASQGRALGVRLWVTAQALAAVAVEGPLKVNLAALLVLRTTRTGSLQAMESTAAAHLAKVPGRAIWQDVTHDGAEVQVCYWRDSDLDALLPLEDPDAHLAPDDASNVIG
jgi:DNA segregation ATPase FtsK/SpoIIIE-like protein